MIRIAILACLVAGCQAVVDFEAPREGGEQCTDGLDNDGNGATDCQDESCFGFPACAGCGNGLPDPGEECDDGNAIPDDGCSPDCRIDAACGNGRPDPNEECDDGNNVDTDGCRNTCRVAFCGDGVTSASEACDDGNTDDNDGCVAGCVLATCGDGFVNAGVEDCDDQNVAANDGCLGCVLERCGDGTPQTGDGVVALDFEWLASACSAAPGTIEFKVAGVSAVAVAAEASSTCTCSPPGSTSITVTDSTIRQLVLNGLDDFSVDYSGTGHFLAWAMVTVRRESGTTPIVIYEGEPGAATARVQEMCTVGFAENTVKQVSAPVVVFESCDDGNTVDDDACSNSCRFNNPP